MMVLVSGTLVVDDKVALMVEVGVHPDGAVYFGKDPSQLIGPHPPYHFPQGSI